MPFRNDILYPLIEQAVREAVSRHGGPATREQIVDVLKGDKYVLEQAAEDGIARASLPARLLHYVDFFNANMTRGNEYAEKLNRARVDGRYVLWPRGTSGIQTPDEERSEAICFVIQPFDGGPYDKRYEETIAPAIRAAHIEPYRVDQDPGVAVPIEDVENGIRNADICLADISEDNPNVWLEVGFARACSKPLVMICSARRERFPFDVQHLTIVRYQTQAASDFETLSEQITMRMTALLEGAGSDF